ncbi:hypothetical protein OROMI_004577 [Orobanche minor]
MLKLLGFGDKWVNWIMECVSKATSSVLVNGSPSKDFDFKRGLRQGDPLSPFLFLLVAEGLNLMMKKACVLGHFIPYKVERDSVAISHLQFVDDTIFFGEAVESNIIAIKSLLRCFESVSGLKINFCKSCLIGVGLEDVVVERWVALLNCKVGACPFMYLGLPIGDKENGTKMWKGLVEKVERRLSRWENKTQSFGGRLVLIKSVLGSLPLYFLSFFYAPSSIIHDLVALQRNFLWGSLVGGGRKVAWVSWSKVCESKDCGGLGVKDLRLFNLSLLGKWVWGLLNKPNALWVRV